MSLVTTHLARLTAVPSDSNRRISVWRAAGPAPRATGAISAIGLKSLRRNPLRPQLQSSCRLNRLLADPYPTARKPWRT